MKRRIAPNLGLLLCATAAAATVDATSWLDDHHLHVRPDMETELRYLSTGEFAPLQPNDAHRAMQGQGVMQRERERNGGGGVMQRESNGCSSPLITWTTQQIRDMGYDTYKTLHENKIIQMAYVYKHYIDKNEEEEHFVNDIQTTELQRRHRDTIAFWRKADIDNTVITEDILLLSMHGTDLQDNDRLVPTILRLFNFNAMSDVLTFATKVQQLIANLPQGYNNPLLTMNAIATRSTYNHGTFNGHDDPSRRVKDSIIIGDGVLQFLYESGLQSSGPDFVHAHEFGHHLQFRIEDLAPGRSYDDRRKELMADAISGYFLAHDEGGDMMAKDIGIFDETAFSTGDCSVTSKDHHGTPKQRRCAAIWGASRAAPDHVPILDPEVFVRSFNEAYQGILDLRLGDCTLVLEETTSLDYSPEAEEDSETLQGYQEDEEWTANTIEGMDEKEPVNINDWLDAIDKQNQGNHWDNTKTPSSNKVPDNEDVVSMKPIQSSWETEDVYDIGSRGKPSHAPPPPNHDVIDTRPHDEQIALGRGGASTNLADVGTPLETKQSYMNHGLTVHDCTLPWVYCPSLSSSAASSIAQCSVSFFGQPLYLVSAAIAAALSILF